MLSGALDQHALEEAKECFTELPTLSGGQTIKRIYLHWVVETYSRSADDQAYNVTVYLLNGKWRAIIDTDLRLNATEPPQSGYAAHTWQRNSHACGIAVDAMLGASPDDFGAYPVQQHQLEVLCAVTGAVGQKYGIDLMGSGNVMTHAEVAIEDDYYCGHTADADCRWDLARLSPRADNLTVQEALDNGKILRVRAHAYKLALQA